MKDSQHNERPHRPIRAAIVEDDSFVAEMLVLALSKLGVDGIHFTGISPARHTMLAGKFDFAIIDIGLPDGNGLDFIQELRANPETAKLPVIIATANHDEQLVAHAYSDCSVTLVAHKPIAWSCLSYIVQNLFDQTVDDDTRAGRAATSLSASPPPPDQAASGLAE